MTDLTSIDVALRVGSKRVEVSIEVAKALLDAGFSSPAFVWSVRSAEIFLKDFVLAPHFLARDGGEWIDAVRKADDVLRHKRWPETLKLIDQMFGPLEAMLTEDDEEARDVWLREFIPTRNSIIHGRIDVSHETAKLCIEWVEQLVFQMKLRLLIEKKHPFYGVLSSALSEFFKRFPHEEAPRMTRIAGMPS